jgi:hypothetical protein
MATKLPLRQIAIIAVLTFIITLVVMLVFSFLLSLTELSENVQQTIRGGVLLFTIFLTVQLLFARFRKMATNPTESK